MCCLPAPDATARLATVSLTLRQTDTDARPATPAAVAHDEPSSAAGGADLAATLAAALSARKNNMADSDEEGGSDDEDW